MMTDRIESVELGESVVDEVRRIRESIDAEVGHDLRKLAERARRAGEDVRKRYGMKLGESPAESSPAA